MRTGLETFDRHNTPIGSKRADCEEVSANPAADVASSRRRIPELDGLRGLAVVAVVAYHAWPDTVPGGWLGVSVFFTLSGFLITSILVRDHSPTRASLSQFWFTRARRLLPAALMVIGVVVSATAIVDPDSVRRVARDALASIWYVQNWREAAAPGGYGAIFDTGLRPLAHMWSLSIEEQAYLVLPILTLWLGPRRMLAVGGLVAVVGTAFWWGSPDAYYATPVRLLEVLAGAALAVWMSEGRRVRVPGAVAVGAAAGIGLGVFTLSESHDFVSRGALPVAALLSAVVIATVQGAPVRALCVRPLLWLGHRSYAIYLFHWPLLVLLDAPIWVAVVLTLVLAEASHHLVESPIRSQRVAVRRPALTFVMATLVAVAVASAGLALGPRPASDAEIAAATVAALADPDLAAQVVVSTTTRPDVSTAGPGVDAAPGVATVPEADSVPVDPRIPLTPQPVVMILGESTANAIEPAVSAWVSVIGGTSIDAGDSGCSPMFAEGSYTRWYTKLVADPTACRERVAAGTDLVVVFDHGVPLFDHFDREADAWTDISEPSFIAAMSAEYVRMIDDASVAAATVVFFTPATPWPNWGDNGLFHTGTEVPRRENYSALVTELAAAYDHVEVVEFGAFVDADPERYPRKDGIHLDAETGAIHAVVDLVAPSFRPTDAPPAES
ncbi:MAG: peptidoglycan/LPS O-acetylase OafA/YrhL [Candidatus Aldehydirespiratoraceae bacterium]|jgi:peptidoglycan/LPS O-acetylase OafA/YrhL